MVNRTLVDKSEKHIHLADPFGVGEPSWLTFSYPQAHGVWKPFSITTQTTTAIASANNAGYLLVMGITVAAKKVNGGNIAIRFSDGTNNEEFFNALTTNGEINVDFDWSNVAVSGWKDANLEIVTSGSNPTLTGMIRYAKINNGLTYAEWDALR